MPRRFSRRRSGNPSKVRAREWLSFNTIDAGGTNPATHITMASGSVYGNYILSPDEMSAAFDEPTLLRARINFSWIPATVPASTDSWLAMGLIAHNLEEAGGVIPAPLLTSLPLPFFDGDSAWIWHWQGNAINSVTLFSGFYGIGEGVGISDVKTRRRFPNGTGLLLVAVYFGGYTSFVSIGGRILLANR